MFARLQQKKTWLFTKGMQRDHILGKWIARTYRAEPRHVGYLLRALPSPDKDTLLMRVYAELSGGGDPQYHGYTVDPYSPYGQHQPQQRVTPPGSWPPAQAVQQQQQWTTQSSVGKTVMADLDRQRTAQAVQAVLRSDSHTIKCYAQCSLSWRFGSGCNVWSGGRCSNAAATILKDEQGQYLDANATAMEAKIQQMSHEEGLGSITSTAPLIPQAGNVARQEEDTQGFICVCQDHADKIAEWAQSSLPSLGLKLAALGVAAYGGKKLYSMATANKERDEATREYELIQKKFRNLAQTKKTQKVALLLQKLTKNTLDKDDVAWLRENGMTLDTAPTEDGACTWAGQAPASPAEQMLQQAEKERKKLEETQLEAALIAYKDKVLSGNPEGLPWQEALKDSPGHIQALLGSAEIRAGLGL
jgi:hypothetical protein